MYMDPLASYGARALALNLLLICEGLDPDLDRVPKDLGRPGHPPKGLSTTKLL